MNLISLASTFPEQVLTQEECWIEFQASGALEPLKPSSRKLLEKILLNANGIDQRHLAVSDLGMASKANPGMLNRLFEEHAVTLSTQSLEKALRKSGVVASELDALFICTCTGYLCPGLSSYVSENVGLRSDVDLIDLVGQGCGAAIPLLKAASNYLAAHPGSKVACIATEISSAAFFAANDPGVLISLALFGDASSASIWGNSDGGCRLHDFQTIHLPEKRETLRFVNDEGFLRNKLDRSVPQTVGDAVEQLYEQLNQKPKKIITHSGGRDVLDAIEKRIPGCLLDESRETLRQFGNTSSSSVMLALEKHLSSNDPSDDIWLASFGAGVTCHGARLTCS